MPVSDVIRAARPEDAAAAVPLLRLSMAPASLALFEGLSSLTCDETLAGAFRSGANRFSWQHAAMCDVDGRPAGLLISYPGWRGAGLDFGLGLVLFRLHGLPGMLRLIGRVLPAAGMQREARDEHFISQLAVLPEFQRGGIGTRLLERADELARGVGLIKCSLLVDAHNAVALRLYERAGYRIVRSGFMRYRGTPAEAYHRTVKLLPEAAAA